MRILCMAGLACLALVPGACSYGQEHFIKRGNEAVAKYDDRAALELFHLALQAGESNHRLYQVIAEAHARLREYDEAIDNYLTATELLKKDLLKYSKAARSARDHLRRIELMRLCDDRIIPYLSLVHTKMGAIYELKKDHAMALLAYKQALFDLEKNLRARYRAALLFERKGDAKAALKEWQLFIKCAERASVEDRLLYGVEDADIVSARRHVEQLSLGNIGWSTDKPEK